MNLLISVKLFSIIFIFFIQINLVIIVNCKISDILKIILPNGSRIIGKYLRSHNGKGIRSFLAIPYAEPPISDLRFKAPIPIRAWSEERHMTSDSEICIQRSASRRTFDIEGSEDCLYLNVHTPQLIDAKNLLPIMVFFHGGGWMENSGTCTTYPPDYLLDHEIILITANYRLGILGFLSTGQEDCPGNFGLKDKILVLKWIQENIISFGGDNTRVTIFGNSAGAASVTYLMQSPLATGLFHRAISQSGINLSYWARPAEPGVSAKRASKVGHIVGCPLKKHINKNNNNITDDVNWAEMVNCLRTKSAIDITNALNEFYEWDFDPEIPFTPVIEPNIPGACITEHPSNVSNIHGLNIPIIIGMNLDDGVLKSAPILNIPGLYDDLKRNWYKLLPMILYYNNLDNNVQNEISDKITKFYFGNNIQDEWQEENLTNIFTDSGFLAGLNDYLRIRLSQNNVVTASTYVYLFMHKGAASFSEFFVGGDKDYGVCHADEIRALFPTENLFISAVPTELDIEMRKIITKLWVNFAETGNPTPLTTSALPIIWKPATKFPLDYMRLGNLGKEGDQLVMESNLIKDRSDFWLSLQSFIELSENEKKSNKNKQNNIKIEL